MRHCTQIVLTITLCCGLLGLTAPLAYGQYLGGNFAGDYGIQAATQASPGFYLAGVYIRYDGETLRDAQGNPITLQPGTDSQLDVNGFGFGILWVSNWKIFGANYSACAFPSFANGRLEAPILGLDAGTGTGWGDLYVQPINLGWHTTATDITAGIGVYAPTGRYTAGADDNLGLGMWSFELYAGGTVYFDQKKSWSFSTMAWWETHTEKIDTDIKVGNILTLEGGLGKGFKDGLVQVGAAYYAQWKMTHDDLGSSGEELGVEQLPKHRGFGLGPEVMVPIATKKSLIAILDLRYFWEFGNRTTVQGRTFTVTATFPIPSISLQ